MKILSNVMIKGIGAALPDKVVTNDDLSKIVETSDEWISTRTGIKERRNVTEFEGCTDLAFNAVMDLKNQGYEIDDVDLIIVATMSPDYYTPSVSAQLQGKLGLNKNVMVLDINAACAGFSQAIQIASSLISVGQNNKALIIGVEVLSKIIDYNDRTTCVLFGDGAGVVLMERGEERGLLAVNYGADGKAGDKLYCSNLNHKIGETEISKEKQGFIVQDGRGVYNFVVKNIPQSIREMFIESDLSIDDIDWFVPHSANLRMIQSLTKQLNIPQEKLLESVSFCGNTSAATIPLAIWRAKEEGKLKSGDLMLIYGFGGGLNHSGAIFRWFNE